MSNIIKKKKRKENGRTQATTIGSQVLTISEEISY